jgi:hypothetical protein
VSHLVQTTENINHILALQEVKQELLLKEKSQGAHFCPEVTTMNNNY